MNAPKVKAPVTPEKPKPAMPKLRKPREQETEVRLVDPSQMKTRQPIPPKKSAAAAAAAPSAETKN